MSDLITIAVTGLKYIESPQPGYGLARSLKEAGYRVIGIDDSPLNTAFKSKDFDKVYVIRELIKEDKIEFLEKLRLIKEKENIRVIIPGFDREIFFFNSIRYEIEELGIKVMIPSSESLVKASKPHLYELNDKGIAVAETIKIRNFQDVEPATQRLGFPVVCKGLLKDAYVAESLTKAKLYFDIVRERWGGGQGSMLFQKYIAGEPIVLIGIADQENILVRAFVMKKLGTDSKGTTWSGYSLYDEKLISIAKKFTKETKWVGPFELEFLRTYETQEDFMFEVNPRFPSWVYFATAVGLNLPDISVRALLGERVGPDFTYVTGKAFIRCAEEKIVELEELQRLKRDGTI